MKKEKLTAGILMTVVGSMMIGGGLVGIFSQSNQAPALETAASVSTAPVIKQAPSTLSESDKLSAQDEVLNKLDAMGDGTHKVALIDSPALDGTGYTALKLPGGIIAYLTEDSKYMFVGNMVDTTNLFDIGNEIKGSLAKVAVENFEHKDDIVYPAENEVATIYVFTDVTCPYCTQLHQQIPELNKRGFTVHYLPFPRDFDGMNDSPTVNALADVLCSKDKYGVLDDYFNKKRALPSSLEGCGPEKDAVKESHGIGVSLGITGTPGWVMVKDGKASQYTGYLAPEGFVNFMNEAF